MADFRNFKCAILVVLLLSFTAFATPVGYVGSVVNMGSPPAASMLAVGQQGTVSGANAARAPAKFPVLASNCLADGAPRLTAAVAKTAVGRKAWPMPRC